MYRLFNYKQYVSDHDSELFGVCVSKSRLLTFLGNEFSELFIFVRIKVLDMCFTEPRQNMQSLLSHALQPNNCTSLSCKLSKQSSP